MHPRVSKFLLTTTALSALGLLALGAAASLALGARPATAGPEGGTVVGGAATIAGQGTSSVVVNQSTGSAIINWHTFNIGAGQSVTFNQPGSSSIALNRVTGGLGPSEILGTLTANGKVFVINRDGILFGPGAVINTAGFLATTNDIKNSDFMAGRMNFNIPGRPDASIVNLGNITATSGGFAALVAPGVRNSGTITATLGAVTLAAGNSFTLDLYGDKLITLAVNDEIASKVIDVATGQPLKSLITNDGKIKANGGRVELTAAAARHVVDSVINTSGVIKANSIGTHNGMIVLSAATGGSKGAGAPAQTIKVSGTLSAAGKKSGTTGGTILVTGEDIQFVNALVDASGSAGGGKVMIGGDWGGGNPASGLVNNQSAKLESFLIPTATTVSVDAGTTINASAKDSGNGGKVILWSDVQTTFAGTILAKGGAQSGNGGFVETSGHQLAFTGTVDTRAPYGAAGTLLLDPYNVTISTSASISPGTFPPNGIWEPTDNGSNINVIDLQNQLALGNVIVTTTSGGTEPGNITVQSSFTWTGNNSLTLSAHNNIAINSLVTIKNVGGGSLTLRADSDASGAGYITFASPGQIDFSQSTGKVAAYYKPLGGYTFPDYPNGNPISSLVLTNPSVTNQYTAYMLVNNATDLTNISTNLAGTYALGKSIDGASSTIAPIGSVSSAFTGLLDGNGYSIANFKIQATGSTDTASGLFASIGASGVVKNLELSNISVNANPAVSVESSQFLGTLAGVSSGTITNVNIANSTVNSGALSSIIAGGLVGQLQSGGTIAQSSATMVNVTTGNAVSGSLMNNAGGLVGVVQSGASIIDSHALGGIVTTGINTFAGGLVGRNDGSITNSSSSNAVSGVAGDGMYDIGSAIGGLAGFNSGTISGSFAEGPVQGSSVSLSQPFSVLVGGLVGLQNSPGQIINSYANGVVTGTGKVELGGLVGANFASISGSHATGSVSTFGASQGQLGGLVGFNAGASATITSSNASGPVTGTGSVSAGGLVGVNDVDATINNSFAIGSVTTTVPGATDHYAGGLVGENQGLITNSYATGAVTGNAGDASVGGLAGINDFDGTISNSFATGNVTVIGAVDGWGGGLVGGNAGTINGNSFATGNVSVNAALALAGGLMAFNFGDVDHAYATGNVNVSGTVGVAGGLVGVNMGFLNQTFATGAVGGSAGFNALGGFVGANTNVGTIFQAYATGPVTGAGTSVIGGFAAVNVGSLEETYAIGKLTGGTITGGLVAANTNALLPPALTGDPDIGPTLTGTGVVTSSYWDPATTGAGTSAAGSTRSTQDFLTALPAGFSTIVWSLQPNPSYPHFGWQPSNTVPTTTLPPSDLPLLPPPTQVQVIDNLIQNVQLAALNTTPPLNVQGGIRPPQFPPAVPPGFQPPPSFPRLFDIPPLTETRFISDEVMVQITSRISMAELESTLRRFGLTLLASERLAGTDTILLRFRITDGKTVREIIQLLASTRIDALVQPNYFFLADQKAEPASRGDPAQQGDAAQYILQKLKLPDVHRLVKGANVPIAVIDSEIDAAHPDLQGVIAQRFSAVGAPETPHSHGTGMAGAIASRLRVIGVAPSSRLLAVHAFSTKAASAESTTFNILKGIDWSVSQGARIINMSFAGPKDPSLERALKSAYDKGVVLIAAAGNAGPKSPPLYPGADPHVIAVTATDADDRLFVGANRGKYVAVAAPGVDILVPAPDNSYQLTTGTSVAAAEVSGIAALLLERNPRLTPADIRRILTGSAKRLGAGDRDDNFGSGLVDPLRALQSPEPRTVTSTTTRR